MAGSAHADEASPMDIYDDFLEGFLDLDFLGFC